jgi:REP element-mobilizing transposase RayT
MEAITHHIKQNSFKVYAYVIMKNHFHLICKSPKLSNIIQSIKSYTSKRIIEQLNKDNLSGLLDEFSKSKKSYKKESTYQIWQESYYPKEILDEKELKQKINYIHYNPVKGGYCTEMTEWKHSSAGFYILEGKSLIEIERLV